MSFKDKVVYQIYPRSFKDSDGDGTGDIRGIIEKLDYLSFLGVDLIWLTPVYVSPQCDNGYDVQDYYAIDPIFGTMEDMEELIREGQKRDIGIMMDMVFNHTSTQHEWFRKALEKDPFYRQFYIFKEGKDGKKPTNWQSKFGGSAWEKVGDEYYLHLFDKGQADLNWENPCVRNELIKVLRFWLDKGVKGFRFDVVNLISKDIYRDAEDGLGKEYYTDGKNVGAYLHELNIHSFGKQKDVITVGEMSATSIEKCAAYTDPENEELDMVFSFHHLKTDYENGEKWSDIPYDFKEFKRLIDEWQNGMQERNGWNSLFLNCHDQPRSVSRFGDDGMYHEESAKMLGTLIHMLRGTPYIYQGEEIGMTNAYFDKIDDYRDVESLNCYKILKEQGLPEEKILNILQKKSRDNARTPMQWNSHGGFSDAEPWIAMNPNCMEINVEDQINDPDSILNYYRKLIELRKEYKIISEGTYVFCDEKIDKIFSYKRKHDQQELYVICNFSSDQVPFSIKDRYQILLDNYERETISSDMILQPYEAIVLYRDQANCFIS